MHGRRDAAWRPLALIVAAMLALTGLFVPSPASASSDPWNGANIVKTSFPGIDAVPTGIAVQSDGKTVVVGTPWIVARYNKNGTLDTTFDTDGWVNTTWPDEPAFARGVAIDAKGRIVVTGVTESEESVAIARYRKNGNLDPNFNGGGRRTIRPNASYFSKSTQGAVFVDRVGPPRFNPNGSLAVSFEFFKTGPDALGEIYVLAEDGVSALIVVSPTMICPVPAARLSPPVGEEMLLYHCRGKNIRVALEQTTGGLPKSGSLLTYFEGTDAAAPTSYERLYVASYTSYTHSGMAVDAMKRDPASPGYRPILDTSFSLDGRKHLLLPGPSGPPGITVDDLDRVVQAATYPAGGGLHLAIRRIDPDGDLDETLGDLGDLDYNLGSVRIPADPPSQPRLTVRPDGTVIIAAPHVPCSSCARGFSLIRIPPDFPAVVQGLALQSGLGMISGTWPAPTTVTVLPKLYETRALDSSGTVIGTKTNSLRQATFGNLDEGLAHKLDVTVIDAFGQRSPTVTSALTTPLATATRAVAPSNVSVITDGPGRLAPSWTQTATSGIDSWLLKASAAGYPDVVKIVHPPTDPVAIPTDTHSSVLSGLQTGVAYNVAVAAHTGAGLGVASSPIVRTVNNVALRPDAPIDLRGRSVNEVFRLDATAGSEHGSPVTLFRFVRLDSGEGGVVTETTIGTSATPSWTGVQGAGALQRYGVYATNAGGESSRSEIIHVRDAAASAYPAAPLNPAASATVGSVRVSWTPSSVGSSPLTGYTVYLRSTTDSAANPDKVIHVAAGQTSVAIPVANACQTQSYAVSASNATGESPLSTDASVTALCAPGSMVVAAEPGNGEAYLRWQFPSPLRTLGVSGYRIVQLTPTRRMVATVDKGTQTFDVSGLTNGTAHRFSIAAYNTAGTGPEVEVSVTPGLTGPPGRVRNLFAEPGNGAITMRWDPPASNGGETIIQYHIIESAYSPTSGEVQTVKGATDASIRAFTINGYGPAQARYLSVRAFTSKPGPLARVTGYTNAPPAAPVLTNATGGNASATLAWTHAGNGAIPVKGFRLYRTVTGEPTPVAIDVENVRSVTDTGLTNGITYTYSVVAVNDAGESGWSNEVTATPALPPVPSPLRSLTARVATGQVRLSWISSLAPGPEPYRVEVTRTPVGASDPLVVLSGQATAFNDYSVTDGTTYTYTLRALNSAGASSPVSVNATPTSSDTLPPGAPEVGVAAGPGAGQLTARWDPPIDTGGGAITGYSIYRATTRDGARTHIGWVSDSARSYTDSGLGNGTTRFYSVAATSSLGGGEASLETPGTTFRTPSVPLGLTLTPGPERVTVRFQEPDDLGGAFPPSYLIYRSSATQSETRVATITNGTTSHVDLGLTAETNYSYRVSASTPAGEGPKTALVTTRTLAPIVPTAPINLVLTEAPQRLDLAWSPPLNNGGASIFAYHILRGTQSGSLEFLAAVGNVTTYSDTGRRAGVTAFYQVVAVNRAGFSPPSNEVSGAALLEPPSAPRNFTATPTPGTAQQPFATTLRWSPPTSDGGAPLTNYAVYEQTGSEPERWIGFVPPAATSIIVSGSPVTPYRYRIRALNPLEGAFSAQVCMYHFPWIAALGCPA